MSFVAIEECFVCYNIQVGSVEQQGVKCSNDAAHENVARVVDTEINSAVGVNNCPDIYESREATAAEEQSHQCCQRKLVGRMA